MKATRLQMPWRRGSVKCSVSIKFMVTASRTASTIEREGLINVFSRAVRKSGAALGRGTLNGISAKALGIKGRKIPTADCKIAACSASSAETSGRLAVGALTHGAKQSSDKAKPQACITKYFGLIRPHLSATPRSAGGGVRWPGEESAGPATARRNSETPGMTRWRKLKLSP